MKKHELGFLNALRKNPWDDATRRMYADCLDDPTNLRGEYLRVVCELATLTNGSDKRPALLRRLCDLSDQVDAAWEFTVCRPYAVVLHSYDIDVKYKVLGIILKETRLPADDVCTLAGGLGNDLPRRPLPKIILQGLALEEAERIARRFPAWESTVRVIPEQKKPTGRNRN
jgi:uncharacterized protein (TIGR02996 family)